MTVVLVVILIMSMSLNVILCVFLTKFIGYVMRFEDAADVAIDELDKGYAEVGKLLNRPLLYDNAEVRYIMKKLNDARESVLRAARAVAEGTGQERDNKTSE